MNDFSSDVRRSEGFFFSVFSSDVLRRSDFRLRLVRVSNGFGLFVAVSGGGVGLGGLVLLFRSVNSRSGDGLVFFVFVVRSSFDLFFFGRFNDVTGGSVRGFNGVNVAGIGGGSDLRRVDGFVSFGDFVLFVGVVGFFSSVFFNGVSGHSQNSADSLINITQIVLSVLLNIDVGVVSSFDLFFFYLVFDVLLFFNFFFSFVVAVFNLFDNFGVFDGFFLELV